jgi:hypothetical protein
MYACVYGTRAGFFASVGLERMIENERVPSKAQDEALWLERTAEIDLERSKAHIPHPFCVVENYLLETHTMDNLPANEGYRSHQILDFARMGE